MGGASSAAVVALVDSQNGEIYAYTIEGVKYYTGWRQSIYTTWGYPSERNVYCKTRDEDNVFLCTRPHCFLAHIAIKGREAGYRVFGADSHLF